MGAPSKMLVADRMTPSPVTIAPSDSLAEAQRKMHVGGFRALPVLRNGRLVGIVSDRDTRPFLGHLADIPVKEAMTRTVVTVRPETPLEHAAQMILRHKIGALPVLQGGELVGIISTTDILAAFVRAVERVTE